MANKMKGVTSKKRNGVNYWYAYVYGQEKYCGKGREGYNLARSARKKFDVAKAENRVSRAGIDKAKERPFSTVRALILWYMERLEVQGKPSYTRKLSTVPHLLKFFGSRPLPPAPEDFENYRSERRKLGRADSTITTELTHLKAMFNMARKWGKITADEMPGDFMLTNNILPGPAISDEQYEALLKVADADFKDVLVCGYETGMRSGEVISITPAQVHIDETVGIDGGLRQKASYIYLGVFDTKTGAERIVPISPPLKKVLKRRVKGLDPEDLVFTNTFKGESRNYRGNFHIAEKMKAACIKAGLPYGVKTLNKKGEKIGLTFHSFRRTRTTKWLEAGFSDEIVRRATGHKTLEAYQGYVRVNDPRVIMRLVEQQPQKLDKTAIKQVQSLTSGQDAKQNENLRFCTQLRAFSSEGNGHSCTSLAKVIWLISISKLSTSATVS